MIKEISRILKRNFKDLSFWNKFSRSECKMVQLKETKEIGENEGHREICSIKNIPKILRTWGVENVIVIDSNPYSCCSHLANLVPFPRRSRDANDPCLFYLASYLSTFSDLEDVRTKIKEDFGFLQEEAESSLLEMEDLQNGEAS